jgi:hypothetical protein
MADASSGSRTIHVRLISEAVPPREHGNRPTEFGLKDKKRKLHPGLELPDGSVRFDLELQVRTVSPVGSYRFQGRFVLGKPDEPHIGLIWNYADEGTTIRGQKIRLDAIPSKMVEQAARQAGAILQAKVLPITERTATIHVEWEMITP